MNKTQGDVRIPPTLKLLQISASLESRLGGPVQVVKFSKEFLEKKFDQTLIIFGTSDENISNSISIPTFRSNRYGFFMTPLSKSIRTKFRDSDLILIHGFYLFSTLVSITLAKKSEIFIMPHGSLENYQNRNGRFRKRIFDACFKLLNKSRKIVFLVGSVEEINGVKSKFSNNLVQVVGIGIKSVPDQFLHQGTTKIPLRLLCISRITHKKRIDLCIQAVKHLQDRGYSCFLTIAGDGDEQLLRELVKLAKVNGLESVISFIGFVDGDEKHRLYRESDILLLPSENENFAVSIAESIAHQVPVIVSDAVAMHSFVKVHKTGKVISELNAEVLADAILQLKSEYHQYWRACVTSKDLLEWEKVFNVWQNAFQASDRFQNR